MQSSMDRSPAFAEDGIAGAFDLISDAELARELDDGLQAEEAHGTSIGTLVGASVLSYAVTHHYHC